MASSPSAIQAAFSAAISTEHLRGLAMAIWAAYPEAQGVCKQHMTRDQAHDARGAFRRGLAERNLKNYAHRIPNAVITQQWNEPKTSSHVEVAVGNLILTQHNASGPGHVIQYADFRKTLTGSAQGNLLHPDHPISADQKLYAMLLHGPSARPSEPAFMAVVFPTNDGTEYLFDATINILAMFDDLATAIRSHKSEVIPDDLMLDIRRRDEADEEDEDAAIA